MLVWAKTVRAWAASGLVALSLGLGAMVLFAAPVAPALNAPAVSGQRVTLSWNGVPGALGYRLSVGVNPSAPAYAQNVGAVTSYTFDSPFTGTGWVAVQAYDASGLSPYSNVVQLVIGGAAGTPAAPQDLQYAVSGRNVVLSWRAGMGGSAPLGVLLEAGTSPGAANLGSIPLPISTQTTVPNVPNGTYYARVYAVNASGRSAASNEVRIDMPGGGGGPCVPPPASSLAASVNGTTVGFAWAPVAGVAGYNLEVSLSPTSPAVLSQTFGPGTTSFAYPNAPAGTYYARVVSGAACGAQTGSNVVSLTVTGPPPGSGPRTPNPPPGQRLPLPNMSSVVEAIGRAYPNELRNSCREHGGNNAWLFRLVQELRRYDTRWGLNWKRGNRGDMSQDAVDYNFGSTADEDTTNVYIIDVIGGHCGNNPGAAWIDVTEETLRKGDIGRWTLQPYIAAGGRP